MKFLSSMFALCDTWYSMVFFPSPPFSRSTILFNKKSDVTPFEYKEAEVLAPKT